MSKMAAIDVAIRHQLLSDGKNLEFRKSLGSELGYTEASIQTFLLNVANRLRMDDPSLKFDWTNIDLDRCLKGDLMTLIAKIDLVSDTGNARA